MKTINCTLLKCNTSGCGQILFATNVRTNGDVSVGGRDEVEKEGLMEPFKQIVEGSTNTFQHPANVKEGGGAMGVKNPPAITHHSDCSNAVPTGVGKIGRECIK